MYFEQELTAERGARGGMMEQISCRACDTYTWWVQNQVNGPANVYDSGWTILIDVGDFGLMCAEGPNVPEQKGIL